MTAKISSTFGVGRVAQTRVSWCVAGVESRRRRRRSTSTGAVEQKLGHDPSSGSWNEPDYRRQSTRGRPARQPRYRFPTPSSDQSRSATSIAPASMRERQRAELPDGRHAGTHRPSRA
jgi:hypothetical protein